MARSISITFDPYKNNAASDVTSDVFDLAGAIDWSFQVYDGTASRATVQASNATHPIGDIPAASWSDVTGFAGPGAASTIATALPTSLRYGRCQRASNTTAEITITKTLS